MAEFERELIRERTRARRDVAKRRGERFGPENLLRPYARGKRENFSLLFISIYYFT
jgi:DNA invertase Pin-like site-specific DNA recombinase